MHNIQSSALKPLSSQITCATNCSKTLNYAAIMCLVRYHRIEPLILRLWKRSAKIVNLVPHHRSQRGSAELSDRMHDFSTIIPWY